MISIYLYVYILYSYIKKKRILNIVVEYWIFLALSCSVGNRCYCNITLSRAYVLLLKNCHFICECTREKYEIYTYLLLVKPFCIQHHHHFHSLTHTRTHSIFCTKPSPWSCLIFSQCDVTESPQRQRKHVLVPEASLFVVLLMPFHSWDLQLLECVVIHMA